MNFVRARRFSGFLLAIIFAVSMLGITTFTPTSTAADDITVMLDGKNLSFDVPPMIQNGRTLVPMRGIFEAMGATVDWNNETRTVTATKGNTTITLTIGSTSAKCNDKNITLDVPAQIVKDRTLVPLRFIGESLGATVDWKNDTRTVVITSPAAAEPSNPEQPSKPEEPSTPDTAFSAAVKGTSTIIKAAAEVTISEPMTGAAYYTATGTNGVASKVTAVNEKAGVWCTVGGSVTIKFYSDTAGTKLVGQGTVTRQE